MAILSKQGHSLPPGLLLNTNTGAITGTPTTVNIQTRTIIVVTDAAGNTGEHPIIFPAVDAAPVSPPAATAPGVPQNFTATPGDREVILSWQCLPQTMEEQQSLGINMLKK